MPRKTKAQEEAERIALLVDDTAQSVKVLSAQIRKLRTDEGWSWSAIGKAVGLPGYCCMVLAGEIVKNREPSYSSRRR